MIRFERVTRRYEADGRPALDDVTVEFYREDFVFLIGASGSGKSTLLRMILREGLPQRGKVTVAGQNLGLMLERRVPDFRRSIGMVFQDFRLLPDKTVFDNVAFAMRVLGAKRSVIRKRVTKVLEKVDLAHLAKRYPHEISGGEQQRTAIARAIVNDPAILLADEPTGNLDPRASAEVMRVLRWINASGTTVIMATHDRAIVDQANTRVVELHHGRLIRDEPHGSYDAAEGSEVWGHRNDGAGEGDTDIAATHTEDAHADESHIEDAYAEGLLAENVHHEEHHTWEPDQVDHHVEESRDDAIDHVGDHPQDQVMAPGEDPSVLAYDEDPVLQENAPVDSVEELTEGELTDLELAELDPADVDSRSDEHERDAAWEDHEHTVQDAPIDAKSAHGSDLEEQDSTPEEAGLQVTWPENLRESDRDLEPPVPFGDFDGTEMPDLDQDGFTETQDDSADGQPDHTPYEPDDDAASAAQPDHTDQPDLSEHPETPIAAEPAGLPRPRRSILRRLRRNR